MATNNAVNVGLSGSTGTGNFVGATSPTLVTPTLGAATATSLTFNPTTGGIVGTTTNDNAGSGKVGQFVSSVIANASPVSISSATATDLTSISLTAGDWDVWGNIYFISSAGAFSDIGCWTNSTSATVPDQSLRNYFNPFATTITIWGESTPYQRYSLSTTTTIYISGIATFGSGTANMRGGIYARRAR